MKNDAHRSLRECTWGIHKDIARLQSAHQVDAGMERRMHAHAGRMDDRDRYFYEDNEAKVYHKMYPSRQPRSRHSFEERIHYRWENDSDVSHGRLTGTQKGTGYVSDREHGRLTGTQRGTGYVSDREERQKKLRSMQAALRMSDPHFRTASFDSHCGAEGWQDSGLMRDAWPNYVDRRLEKLEASDSQHRDNTVGLRKQLMNACIENDLLRKLVRQQADKIKTYEEKIPALLDMWENHYKTDHIIRVESSTNTYSDLRPLVDIRYGQPDKWRSAGKYDQRLRKELRKRKYATRKKYSAKRRRIYSDTDEDSDTDSDESEFELLQIRSREATRHIKTRAGREMKLTTSDRVILGIDRRKVGMH